MVFEKDVLEFVFVEIVVVGLGYCGIEFFVILVERFGKKGCIKVVDMVFDIVVLVLVGNREVVFKVILIFGLGWNVFII